MGVMALNGKRVLIVEDDYLIAIDLASEIARAGGKPIALANNVDEALDIIASSELDGAIVDVNLMGECSFQVADALADRHIPFAFATAMSCDHAPVHHANAPWLEKPFAPGTVVGVLDLVMSPAKKDRR
jgi:CheY-like chemotaxis protein